MEQKNLNKISFEKFKYFSAPIEKISVESFRKECYENGADVTFTEMIRLKGLVRNNKTTWNRLEIKETKIAVPTIVQLVISNEKDLTKFLEIFKPFKGFKGFNINVGCPSSSLIKIGLGCAAMKRVTKIQNYIDIIKKYDYGVSVKLRLGMNKYERNKKIYLNLIKTTTPDFFVVHARDGTQNYSNPADFKVYKECVETGKVIVANGDIKNAKQINYLKSRGVKGAMIGREAVKNKKIFNELKKNL